MKAIDKAKKRRGGYVEPKAEIEALSKKLKSYFEREMNLNNSFNIIISELKKDLLKNNQEKHLILLEEIIELSKFIYLKLKSYGKIETIDDAEILLQKIKTIENLIWNKRYDFINFNIRNPQSIKGVGLATKSPDDIRRICNQLKSVISKV